MTNLKESKKIIQSNLKNVDLLIVFNMNSKHLIINNATHKQLITTFFNYGVTNFKKLISELQEISKTGINEIEIKIIYF